MADEWTPEEAARHSVEDVVREGMGICDDALMARLMVVDREGTTIFARLRPEQRIALTGVFMLVVANVSDDLDLNEKAAMFRCLAYGFQLGHDYALEHGRLGEE